MSLQSFAADRLGGPILFNALESRINELRVDYANAEPWPHVVIDDFLEAQAASRLVESFPPIGKTTARLARLLAARSYDGDISGEDIAFAEVFEALHGKRFTDFVESVTGVRGLAADRQLVGAGLHQGSRGSYLRVHADHNTHPADPKRFRRINIMIYLNSDWEAEWNGDLELWDRDAIACRKRIEPRFNRCVILSVDDTAFHGYGPLRTPSNVTRKALAEYYYCETPALGQAVSAHSTTMPTLVTENPLIAVFHRARRSVLFRLETMLKQRSP